MARARKPAPMSAPTCGFVRVAYDAAMAEAAAPGPMDVRWAAAERAHILSQPWPGPHARTHAVMLRLAVRDRDLREIAGQVIRLLVAAPGSALGKYPVGNTGRARVGLTEPMPLPDDLAVLLQGAGIPLAPG